MIELKIKPCPYCGRQPSVERSAYDIDGRQLAKGEPRTLWIAKCSECAVITPKMPSRLTAIISWNRKDFNALTYIANQPNNTDDPDTWENFRNAIILAATEELKDEAVRREARRANGGAAGSKLEGESWFYSDAYKRLDGPDGDAVVRGIKAQAPYLYWKERMGCRHCAVKEEDCPHKRDNTEWRAFNKGVARGCVKREGDDST